MSNVGSSPRLSQFPDGRCIYQPECPGCPHFGVDGIATEPLLLLEGLATRAGAPSPEVVATPGWGSRHRVRLSVRGPAGNVGIGIFQAKSHDLVSILDCPLHHESIRVVTRELKRLLDDAGVAPYREPSHPKAEAQGLVRTLQLAVERPSQRVQVVLVVSAQPTDRSAQLVQLFQVARRLAAHPLVQGLYVNFQPLRTNTLLGETFVWLCGAEVIADRSGGADVYYPPGAFGQANPEAHDLAVARIHAAVGDRPVMEYYAGVGTIGLGLLLRGNRVWFNELGSGSLAGLRRGLSGLPPTPEVQVLAGSADQHAEAFRQLDNDAVVVVDPPRKGLDGALIDALTKDRRPELLYLSCGLPSLLSDAEVLLARGYRLLHLTAFSYFPFTNHVETLARFA